MRKVDQNKQQKQNSLLNSALQLFINQGFHKTSISEIVENAGVAKGTFYLYFKDKYDLRNKLIVYKSNLIFHKAHEQMRTQNISSFEDQVIFIINSIIDQLIEDRSVVSFLSKHLSWGFFMNTLIQSEPDHQANIHDLFLDMLEQSETKFSQPELMMYMIIELVSGTSYNSIIYQEPVPIETLKPHLYKMVRNIIHAYELKPE